MKSIAQNRATKVFNKNSSFANAAISQRLETIPQRFFWSGYQTYNDFCRVVKQIREGTLHNIPSDTTIDLFGYSIGAFFSLWLMLDNPYNYFSNSKLFIFCGGTTYDRTFPVSKYIIDKRAYDSVTHFYQVLFNDKELYKKKLNYYFKDILNSHSYFPALMDYGKFTEARDKRLKKISDRIKAMALVRDDVIPPKSVNNMLHGNSGNINTKVDVIDYPYPYNHVTPFPLVDKYKTLVNDSFKTTFDKAAQFLM